MKKYLYFILAICLLIPSNVHAQRGCCSHHGGVASCNSNGRSICGDGTLSPSCTCTPSPVYGCTNQNAKNYNPNANADDGSCILTVPGCMDQTAINYNASANTSDGSCQYKNIITEKENIQYKTVKKKNVSTSNSQKRIQKGTDGIKEIDYEIISNENNQILSKTKINEKIILEPIDEIIEINEKKSNKNSDLSILNITLWLFTLGIVFFSNTNFKRNTLFEKIKKQTKFKIIYFIIYILFIIPSFIDAIIIIVNFIKTKQNH